MAQKPPSTDGRSQLLKGDAPSIDALKNRADELGLTPYASIYGDRRCKTTWLRLLADSELQPLQQRQTEKSNHVDIKLAIALFIGAIALLCLLKPVYSKALPVRITITIEQK